MAGADFSENAAWSCLAFFSVPSTNPGDDQVIVAKWGDSAPTRQFALRIDAGVAPQEMEILTGGNSNLVAGSNVEENTLYLVCVTMDGDQSSTDLKLYLINMDGTFLDDGVSANMSSDRTDMTAPIQFGVRGTADPLQGDIGYVSYFDRVISKNEMLAYLRDPIRTAKAIEAQSGAKFIMPIWGLHSPEIDLSTNGVVGTVTGTVRANDPPVTLFTPKWAAGAPLIEVAAGGGFAHTQAVIIA